MAADAAGNDIANVFIPITGFFAFAPYGTTLPTPAELGTYGYTPPAAWKRAGLITVDGGFGWGEDRAESIEFFQDGYQTNAGNGTATLAVKLAETSANVRQMLRNATADVNGVIDVDIDMDVRWALYTEEVDKLGRIRRRVAPNGWLDQNAADRSTRGEVAGNEATFTVRRDASLSNKHFREAVVEVDAAPNAYIWSVMPSGATATTDVLIRGNFLGTSGADITALTVGGVAMPTRVWIDSQNVIATMPAGTAGSAPIILTTTSGGGPSNTFAYTRGA